VASHFESYRRAILLRDWGPAPSVRSGCLIRTNVALRERPHCFVLVYILRHAGIPCGRTSGTDSWRPFPLTSPTTPTVCAASPLRAGGLSGCGGILGCACRSKRFGHDEWTSVAALEQYIEIPNGPLAFARLPTPERTRIVARQPSLRAAHGCQARLSAN
jgi:hypothetical protein